jgi:hypothetical protein
MELPVLSVAGVMLGYVKSDLSDRLRAQAFNQAGVVTRAQVIDSGMSPKALEWRLKTGTWLAIYPGVYVTFTGSANRAARLWAAVLYAGEGAHLSHETAAEINKLTDGQSRAIHVTIPAHRRIAPPEGVMIHRSSQQPMVWRPPWFPPYTIAEKTIIDLIQTAVAEDDVIALVTAGFNRKLLTEPYFRAVAEAHKKLRWRRELDEIITMAAGGTHSPLEYRHDRDVQRAHGLPEPARQAKFAKPDGSVGYRDRCYPQYGGLVIELDGRRFHPDERRGLDQERDNQAAVTGSTLRYGWTDVTRRACETARQEAEALHHRGWAGQLRPCSPDCRAVAGRAAVRRSEDTLRPRRTAGGAARAGAGGR